MNGPYDQDVLFLESTDIVPRSPKARGQGCFCASPSGRSGVPVSARFRAGRSAAWCSGIALFLLARPAVGIQPEVIYQFSGTNGAGPYAALIQTRKGNLCGTTTRGGASDLGTVFCLTPKGVLLTSVSFANTNGAFPYGPLLQARDGRLYGTTSAGGWLNAGTVFCLGADGGIETLATFVGTNGSNPRGQMVEGPDGCLYGTTVNGGVDNAGVIFRLTPTGCLSTIHSFSGRNGAFPYGGLVRASDGNFYGTTRSQSADGTGGGMIFRISPNAAFTMLASFNRPGEEGGCYSSLVQAKDGSLYGTAIFDSEALQGAAFRLTTGGRFTGLVNPGDSAFFGGRPFASLIQASDGNLYGTTAGDANRADSGSIYQLTTNGDLTPVCSFDLGQGAAPNGGLLEASDGNLYGPTSAGGRGYGLIYRLRTRPWIEEQPLAATNKVGGMAFFSVWTDGIPPLKYRWQKNGADFVDPDQTIGAATSEFGLMPLTRDDSGNYRVIVQNSFGSVTSAVARLSVAASPQLSANDPLPGSLSTPLLSGGPLSLPAPGDSVPPSPPSLKP